MVGAIADAVSARLLAVRVEIAVVDRLLRSGGANKRLLRAVNDVLERCNEIEALVLVESERKEAAR
jgi:phosphoglycerate dehydrogenase-like enzyme